MVRRSMVLVMVLAIAMAVLAAACGGGKSTPPDARLPPVTYALDPAFGVDGQLTITHPESREARAATLIATAAGQFTLGTIVTDDGVVLAMCRITSTGALDATFGAAGCVLHPFLPDCLACVTTNGTDLFIVGRARYNDPVSGPAILRIRASDGTVDTTYGVHGALELDAPPPTIGVFSALRRMADGSLLAIGAAAFDAPETWAQRVVDDATQPVIELPSNLIVPAADGNLLMFRGFQASPNACPATGCNTGQSCRYEQCTIALASCQPTVDCPPNHSCDEQTNECLPSTIGPVGTDITRLSPELAILATTREPNALTGFPFPLADGRTVMIVTDPFTGFASWAVTPEGKRDREFGSDDGFAVIPYAQAFASRPDGGFVLATSASYEGPDRIFELRTDGSELTRFELPIDGPVITTLHLLDDSHLLAIGHHGRHVVVMRLIRTVTPR